MNIQSRFRDLDVSPARSKTRKGWFARYRVLPVLVVIGLLALGAGYYMYGRGNQNTGTPIIVTAMRGDIEDVVTAVGNLQPLTSVDVGAKSQVNSIACMCRWATTSKRAHCWRKSIPR